MKYNQGDIIILELPFTDLVGSKLRPVLVINKDDLGSDLVVLKIAGALGKFGIMLEQEDLAEGKPKKRSYIDCSSIFTVDKSLVVKRVGRHKERKMKEVLELVKKDFRDFEPPPNLCSQI